MQVDPADVRLELSNNFWTDRPDLGFWEFVAMDASLHVSSGVISILSLPNQNTWTLQQLMTPSVLQDFLCSVEEQLDNKKKFDISVCLQLRHLKKWVRITGKKQGETYKGIVEDLSEVKSWQEEQRRKASKALENKKILLDIANATSANQEVTLEQITALVANSMNVARVGIWKLNEQRTAIDLEVLYNLKTGGYESGARLEAKDYPSYFQALETQFNIVADDALTYPHTCEFSESYLKPMGITSMMDVFIQLNGEFYGIICMEHVGAKRTWSEEEQEFAASIAALVSLNLERKQRSLTEQALSRSEERYKGIFNSLVNIFFAVDASGLITEISPSCEKILGYRPHELIGKAFDEILKTNIDRKKMIEHLLQYGEINKWVVGAAHKDGHEIFLEVTTKLKRLPQNSEPGAISIARDVTEMKLAEEKIHKSLRDKELLLRELSHRTKNNLQVIQSMVALKMLVTKNEEFSQIGKEIVGKIQTMALVHRKLYQAKSVSLVNVLEYVNELVELIEVAYLIDKERIKVDIDIPATLKMKIDTLTPFGLVLNELLTNSFKYAFISGEQGTICIHLIEKEKDQVQVTYMDDGKGFEKPFDLQNSIGLGLPTVFNLVTSQMMGEFTQPDPHRARFQLSFPLSVHSDRI